ncbi:MAG: DUF4190 domain-containing protein [Clostridiales Family XIII bacterium]|jgi:hypothetical protein|nr:DUF4190 domain-containing protein [Clostridiales Family XIII bacterium]
MNENNQESFNANTELEGQLTQNQGESIQPPIGNFAQPPTGVSGLAIAGLVVGIIAVAGSWIPLLNFISIIMGIVAIGLSVGAFIVTVKGIKKGKEIAIAGIVLGIITIVLFIVMYGTAGAVANKVGNDLASDKIGGFDGETNQTLSFYGIDFSFPSYFDVLSDKSTETCKMYYPEEEDYYASLEFDSDDFTGTQEEFEDTITDGNDGIMDTLRDNGYDVEIKESEETTIAGLSGWVITLSIQNGDVVSNVRNAIVYNINEGKIIFITVQYDSTDQSNYDYFGDFDKMNETAILVGKPADNSQSTGDHTTYKQFLEEYEAWVDNYIALLEKYQNDPTDLSILDDYTAMTKDMLEWSEKAEQIQGDLTGDDLIDYMETMTRITKKLTGLLG